MYVATDGALYVDGVSAAELRSWAEAQGGRQGAPLYVYSKAQLDANYAAYASALEGLPHIVGYAIKANNNPSIASRARELGAGAVLVSGAELDLAVLAGFDPAKCVLNGNGKTIAELEKAVRLGTLINVDSEFDAADLAAAARSVGRRARAMLRINPEVDPKVHPYVSTGIAGSKFGIRNTHLEWFLEWARENKDAVELVGVHSHLGSTITEVGVFRDAAVIMLEFVRIIREAGFPISYLNIGGGLGIDYRHGSDGSSLTLPTPTDLVDTIRDLVTGQNLTLILEPGRSLVGNTGALLATVIGVKASTAKNFVVVDASMSELIRPALYGAYQHIVPFAGSVKQGPEQGTGASASASSSAQDVAVFDVVGPVCESSDFLGKNRRLKTPAPGDGLAVLDSGAYCMAMASNYNLRMRPQEIWVEDGNIKTIRRAETLDDYLRLFDV